MTDQILIASSRRPYMTYYRKKAILVNAEVLTHEQYVTTLEGVSTGYPGDYLVTGIDYEQWIVKPKWFHGAYKHVTGNQYMRKPQILQAVQITEPEVVQAPTGPIKGDKGDYKVTGLKGEQWFVKPDIFAKTYERVSSKMNKSLVNPAIHDACTQLGPDRVQACLPANVQVLYGDEQGYHLSTDGYQQVQDVNSGTGNGTTASEVEHYIDLKDELTSPFREDR
jgi:hypothetical protein